MKNQICRTITFLMCLLAFTSTTFAQSANVMVYSPKEWPASSDGVTYIPVCWENPQGYLTERRWVKGVVERTWEASANVDFQGWGQCNSNSPGVRILVTDTRSNSHVGNDLDGRRNGMELNFTFEKFSPHCQDTKQFCIEAIAVHEFGHALGLAHEQDRSNSPCNDQVGEVADWAVTEYDPHSVMNYCNSKWNNGGKLSQKDIAGIQRVYGAPTSIAQGKISVSDELGQGQVSETVVLDINGTVNRFELGWSKKKENRGWTFSAPGSYCYKVWTDTVYDDGVKRTGYGTGCYTLEKGKTYTFALFAESWNPAGYWNVSMK